MKKLLQSFESEAQNLQKKFSNYQEKLQGKFQGMMQRSEEKKQRIIQKLQSTKDQLQLSIEKNNPSKVLKLQSKVDQLEAELSKINRNDQTAKDYQLVYDGLYNQLSIIQNEKIQTLTQDQRNDNYKTLCLIKRQAIRQQSQVYKRKHIDPLIQICFHCNELLNQYLKFGVDIQFQQADIFEIDQEANYKLQQLQEQRMLYKQEKKQKYENSQFQSQFSEKEGNYKNKKKDKSNYYEKNQFKQQQQDQIYEQKQYAQQKYRNKHSNQWNDINQLQPKQQYEDDIISEIIMIQQFDNLKIEDKKQDNEIIQQQPKQLETDTTNDDSKLCQICFEFPKEYVATPCGHFVYCHNCKNLAQKQCLICREPVQLLIKVFQ